MGFRAGEIERNLMSFTCLPYLLVIIARFQLLSTSNLIEVIELDKIQN